MRYLPDGRQMKAADGYTIREKKMPSLILMERAARTFVETVCETDADLSDVCVVCGSGNNGGDGFAIARLLLERGAGVSTCMVGNPDHCTEETKRQIQLFREAGGTIEEGFTERKCSLLIDAIFGAGLSRRVEGHYLECIQAMNRSEGKKVAVDVPSGVSTSTGEVVTDAFRAEMTVSFQCEKLGCVLYPGKEFAGEVKVTDIGVDVSEMPGDRDVAYALEQEDAAKMLPKRREDSHKGTYGKVLIIAGSKGMAGAAYLGALAAYKTGAGLVQIYSSEDNRAVLQTLLPEAIVRCYDFFDERELLQLLKWADVVSIGSGLGTSDKSRRILQATLENVEVPCVVDADGLNLLSAHSRYMKNLVRGQFIFTPHMKEMSRITRKSVEELRNSRMEILKQFAGEYDVTCVLKDARTCIFSPGEHPFVNLSGNAAMAKAGSGDVLAGVITGLLAQKMSCFDAAVLGVYLHGLAGDEAKREKGSYSVLARDLAENIGTVLKRLEE